MDEDLPHEEEGDEYEELTDGAAEPVPEFDVRGDETCELDDCRIDSELGRVDASLDTQLARLARAWGVA